jgi:hypothetical protein
MYIVKAQVIDTTGQTESAGTVLYGPFFEKEDAETWAEICLPNVDVAFMFINRPFAGECDISAVVENLIKKEEP